MPTLRRHTPSRRAKRNGVPVGSTACRNGYFTVGVQCCLGVDCVLAPTIRFFEGRFYRLYSNGYRS